MKKCCYIIPYFGKLPDSFSVFLKTCKWNPDFNWLIFTDDAREFEYPENVKKVSMSFEELQSLVKSKFDFPVMLDRPYKLCDLKPAYGYIFEEYIKDYLFWGHCDIDTIMGRLNNFITSDLLEKYDKLFCLGHMILYRNTHENNRVFMTEVDGRYIYKESFSTDKITAFDETWDANTSVNTVFLRAGKNVLMKDWSANFKIFPTRFVKTTFNGELYKFEAEEYKDALYLWDKGEAYRLYMMNNMLVKEEFMYMHFQERKMKIISEIMDEDRFKILPNEFALLEYESVNAHNFKKIKRNKICLHYFQVKYKRLKKKLKRK